MTSLKEQISNATTTKELEIILSNHPVQNNGHKTQIVRLLEDCFWYDDLNTVQAQKEWMIKRIDFYKE